MEIFLSAARIYLQSGWVIGNSECTQAVAQDTTSLAAESNFFNSGPG